MASPDSLSKNWTSSEFRNRVIQEIETYVKNKQLDKSPKELENQIFINSKSREDYLKLFTKLVVFIKNSNNFSQNTSIQPQAPTDLSSAFNRSKSSSDESSMSSVTKLTPNRVIIDGMASNNNSAIINNSYSQSKDTISKMNSSSVDVHNTKNDEETAAYMQKVKELRKYIDPLKTLLSNASKDKSNPNSTSKNYEKMRCLLDSLSNPMNKRMPLSALTKCEEVLVKLFSPSSLSKITDTSIVLKDDSMDLAILKNDPSKSPIVSENMSECVLKKNPALMDSYDQKKINSISLNQLVESIKLLPNTSIHSQTFYIAMKQIIQNLNLDSNPINVPESKCLNENEFLIKNQGVLPSIAQQEIFQFIDDYDFSIDSSSNILRIHCMFKNSSVNDAFHHLTITIDHFYPKSILNYSFDSICANDILSHETHQSKTNHQLSCLNMFTKLLENSFFHTITSVIQSMNTCRSNLANQQIMDIEMFN